MFALCGAYAYEGGKGAYTMSRGRWVMSSGKVDVPCYAYQPMSPIIPNQSVVEGRAEQECFLPVRMVYAANKFTKLSVLEHSKHYAASKVRRFLTRASPTSTCATRCRAVS